MTGSHVAALTLLGIIDQDLRMQMNNVHLAIADGRAGAMNHYNPHKHDFVPMMIQFGLTQSGHLRITRPMF